MMSLNWTDQGIRSIKDSPKRSQAARDLAKKVGVEIKHLYLTSGDSDLVIFVDAPSGDNVAKFALAVSSLGNVRTRTPAHGRRRNIRRSSPSCPERRRGDTPLVAESQRRHDRHMGSGHTRSKTPDLFSTASERVLTSPSINSPPSSLTTDDGGAAASSRSYALPTNLPSALRHLDDDQLDRLVAAVIAEQKRRGKKLPVSVEPSRKRRIKEVAPPLAQGKLNAVRAAFKTGVTPSRIAREFGISQSDVRRALAGDGKQR